MTTRATSMTVAALAVLATTTPASAARLDFNGDVLTYTDATIASVVTNALTITVDGDHYTVDDPAEPIQLRATALAVGCTAVDADTVTCPANAVGSVTVLVRRGDDHVVLAGIPVPAFVDGGSGNDTLVGGDADDFFFWQPGNGSDRIDGGGGSDLLEFAASDFDEHFTITPDGPGFDLTRDVGQVRMTVQAVEQLSLFSGEGTDTVDTTPLAATLQHIEDGVGEPDGRADVLRIDADGRCLERRDDRFEIDGRTAIEFIDFAQVLVENERCATNPCDDAVVSADCTVNRVRHQPCQGTPGDDVIVGSAAGDVIRGGGGRDRIVGRGGDDLLCGEDGADVLLGGAGHDTLVGSAGSDRLDGGSKIDVCTDDDQGTVLRSCERGSTDDAAYAVQVRRHPMRAPCAARSGAISANTR